MPLESIRWNALPKKAILSLLPSPHGRLGIHKNVLGRYERNEVFPSIDIARRIADILDVSLDYLTGKEDVQIDKNTSSRILEVSRFEETDRQHVFSVIDAFIAKRKIQSIMQ